MSLLVSMKRLFRHSAIYGLGHIINRSIGFLLLPLYTNLFSGEAFGVAGVLMTWQALLTLIYVYGLDAGFLRYYIAAEDESRRRTIFSTTLISLLITSVTLSGVLWLAAPRLSEWLLQEPVSVTFSLDLLIRLVIAALLCDTLAFIPLLVLRAEEKSVSYIALKILNVTVNLAANLYFIFYRKQGVEGIFWANLVSSAFTLTMTLPLIKRRAALSFSSPLLKKLFLFGLPALPSGLAIALMDSVDRIFLERLASLQSVGLYNSGSKLGMSMALLVAAFRFAWPPFFLSVAKQADAESVYRRALTYLIAVCFFVFLLISIFLDPISRLSIGPYHLIGPEYWPANRIVPVILLAYIFYAAYLNFYVGVYLKEKTVTIIWATLAGVMVNLLANRALIPSLDIDGAAWARLLSYAAMAGSLYVFSQKYYPIRYEWKRLLHLSLVTAVLFTLARTPAVKAHIWLGVLLLLGFPLLLAVTGFFYQEERAPIRRFLHKGNP